MVTIPVELTNDLARRVLPLQDRLPEIIELGLDQMALKENGNKLSAPGKLQIQEALISTGIVILPNPEGREHKSRRRSAPIRTGGPLASEMIIAERG